MPLTATPVLHRLAARRALETTAFGYEVVAESRRLADCVRTLQWIDCWCPDTAQFILVEVSSDLTASTCAGVLWAITESHLQHKIRLICSAGMLNDSELLKVLHDHEIGFVLASTDESELAWSAGKGALGVHMKASTRPDPRRVGRLLNSAHYLGMRSIASQTTSPEAARNLLSWGFDYVSQRDGGFTPPEPSFAWQDGQAKGVERRGRE